MTDSESLPPPMAGLSTTLHHPYVSNPLKPTFPTHLLTAFLRLRSLSGTVRLPSVSGANTITARYGGSGEGGGSSRRSQSDDDEALDLSSIRSDSVRLVDQQQKMVGVVSKAQAIQMADDAELDLVCSYSDFGHLLGSICPCISTFNTKETGIHLITITVIFCFFFLHCGLLF